MKIARAVIENFRHIERLELDFRDSLGRVRDVVVLVGPNMSGKTTILDALAATIGPCIGLDWKPGFVLNPRTTVRKGALQARVSCWVRFSPDEIAAVSELSELVGESWYIPDEEEEEEVEITWMYPDPGDEPIIYYPSSGWSLFKGRAKVVSLLPTGQVDWSWFERVGGVFTFDQQRTGMGKTIRRVIWETVHRDQGVVEWTSDPRELLLSLAIESLLPSLEEHRPDEADQFTRIQERYAQICAPHRIIGAVRDELGVPDILFSDGIHEYRYDGLSSGEQMILLFLIKMVTEHIHRSIVLVDELELHLHPVWQRKLLHLLPQMGEDNQIIATTHSDYIRDVLPRDALIELGELGDVSRMKERQPAWQTST